MSLKDRSMMFLLLTADAFLVLLLAYRGDWNLLSKLAGISALFLLAAAGLAKKSPLSVLRDIGHSYTLGAHHVWTRVRRAINS